MNDTVQPNENAVFISENAVQITAAEAAKVAPMPTYDAKGLRVDPAYC